MDDLKRAICTAAAAGLSALLAGCAGTAVDDTSFAPSASVRRSPNDAPAPPVERAPAAPGSAIAQLAIDMVGVPYRYGGESPSEGFDCSGLVFYTYTRAGLSVPRTAADLFKTSRKIGLEHAAEGDLVFFQDQRKLSHVGIYVGGNLFVHAPTTGDTVRISSLDSPYYQRHLVAVGRLL